jgi:polysaccharide pyruvyl transferase WcaK-like protein
VSVQLAPQLQPNPTSLSTPPGTRRAKIAFFGVFGIENLGNECTLQSILLNAREQLSNADMYAISFGRDDTALRHHLPAVPVTQQNLSGIVRRGGFSGNVARLGRICRRIPNELKDWLMAIRVLRGTDLVVMTGTGMLTDYATSALGFPYQVFRWTAAARIAGCKVRFVSVGVGPIYERFSRWFIRTALSLADFRSFRDHNSRERIRKIGFASASDHVFPDLVFSLPRDIFPFRKTYDRQRRHVGLGVMDHRDVHIWTAEQHRSQYSRYLEKMCDFVTWLVERNYVVHLLQGDSRHDSVTRADLKSRLEKRGIRYDQAGIIDESSMTVEDLIAQIAEVDVVVSPRFHNLLLGLMMNIPAISISYDPKNDCLLEGIGLGEYRQALTDLDVNKLIDQFSRLTDEAEHLKPLIAAKTVEYRALLEEQYQLIFGEYASLSRSHCN